MLNVATVFSGIGAPEQALKRLGVDYRIVFECDNGERAIDIDCDLEIKKVKSLKSIKEKKEYVDKLYLEKTRRHNFVKDSYLANYSIEDNNYFEDVKLLDGTDFKNKIDLFIGGSPCQSFSIAGARGGFEDTRGTLFYEFARLVKEIQPKVLTTNMQFYLEENVAIGSIQNVDSELKKINNMNGNPEEKYYLSSKLLKYCLSPGTKNFYHEDAEICLI